ncbi:MAG: gliding motility-associated C-terminal domain-containing protein [Bacteroidales bacterium]
MKKHLLFILFILTGLNIFAQTYNMPTNGYLEIHSDSGTIYDDGGPAGNYSTRVNSTVTIYPSTQNAYLIISGNYDFENEYKSKMTLYRGDTNNLEYLTTLSGNGCIAIRSDTLYSPLTIKFIADSETPLSGFNFNFRICTNVPFNISTSNITDSTARINWSESDTSINWIVEYGNGSNVFGIGQGTKIYSDTNFVDITNINKCQGRVYYYIYSTCDTVLYECSYNNDYRVYTQYNYNDWANYHYYDLPIHYFEPSNSSNAFVNSPYNIKINQICNTTNITWQENDTNTIWVVKFQSNQRNYKDSLITSTPFASFELLSDYYTLKICPQNTLNENCDCYNQVFFKYCCSPVQNIQTFYVNETNVTFAWDNDTNAGGWIVKYQIFHRDSNQFIRVEVDTNFITLSNLFPSRPYIMNVYPVNDTLFYCNSWIKFVTKMMALDDCLTFTNLGDVNFAPKYGLYSDPNQNFGLIDYGYWDVNSRHTVHYDTSEVDPRTDSLLHTVPPGEEASVRLGNWLPGGEGESFTYAYDVDTNIFDLMYLRYAVVMENSGHTMTNQPRFTLEILNANDTLIDPVCGYADFFASDSLGWNTVPGIVTIWKDWTLVGFDITPYHGQRILVRLTTRDCDEGGHFGYAYYHLKCGSKKLKSTKCGIVDSNTFIAPIGFNYKWYSSADTSTVLSTDRILDAVVDSTVNYHCLVSSTENPSCTFLYTAYGGYRFPLSQLTYDYTWSPCEYTVNFKNLSTISANGITPAGTNETCETSLWIFPDGDTINTTNATKTFSDTSEVRVRLISGIANNECINILDTVLKLSRPYDPLEISGDTSICFQANTILRLNYSSEKFYWSTADTTSSINVTPLVDTKYYVEVVDSLGCYNFDSINIYVHPMDTTIIYAEICQNEIYSENGFNTNTEGIHEQKLISQWGCDSIVYLNLTVHPTFIFDTIKAIICENNPYTDHGLNLDSTGIYTANLQTIYGCDSIFIVKIHANPVYHDTIKADIYKGNVYNLYGFSEKETGVYSRELKTYLGCDSITYLDLQVDNVLFPNVVTPNGDGINDVFTLNNLVEQDAFPENELIIFNRQGKMIYQKKNIKVESDFWDPQQTKTPNGTYFFRFIGSRHDKKIDKVGSIEVLR